MLRQTVQDEDNDITNFRLCIEAEEDWRAKDSQQS